MQNFHYTHNACFCRMPVIGSKRRNSSEATCDSSHCAFCFQRSRSGLSCIQHDSCPDQTHDSSASQPSNEFETWLKAQTVSTAAHEHISLDKIGLQLPGLLRSPPSKRNRTSIDLGEASSSDSSYPNQLSLPAIYEAGLSLDMPCLSGTAGPPWQWSQAWAEQPDPVPAVFEEIGTFLEPASRQHAAQHTADIVCGVEFSADGHFIASAGVAKQVFCSVFHCCLYAPASGLLCTYRLISNHLLKTCCGCMGLSLKCDRLYQVAPPTAHAYTVIASPFHAGSVVLSGRPPSAT